MAVNAPVFMRFGPMLLNLNNVTKFSEFEDHKGQLYIAAYGIGQVRLGEVYDMTMEDLAVLLAKAREDAKSC